MDPNRFDAIAKSLGAARSRRGVLKMLSAAALGAVAGHAGQVRAAPGGNSAAAAFCHTLFGDTRAAGQCTSQAAHGTGPYYDCQGNPANYCNGACTNIQTDTSNCGACGNDCAANAPANTTAATCSAGKCVYTCDTSAGAIPCGAACCASTQVCTDATTGTCCTPDNTAACSGKCGTQTNNCGESVDCGPCICGGVNYGVCPSGCGCYIQTAVGAGFKCFVYPRTGSGQYCNGSTPCPTGEACSGFVCYTVCQASS